MPEGHTVHRLALAFVELFGGQHLGVSSPQGRFAAGAAQLDGRPLVRTEAHGKQLFLGFGDAGAAGEAGDGAGVAGDGAGAAAGTPDAELRWLRVHLGLYGSWTFAGDTTFAGPHAIGAPRRRVAEEERALPGGAAVDPDEWSPPEPRGAVRVRLVGRHGVADLTGPTACEVVTAAEKAAVQARLGPDPLRPDGDVEAFVAGVRARRRPVGELLMDQAVIAGVGNIYRAEVLYRARVHPRRLGRDVPAARLREMWADTAALMADGVAVGRIRTTRPEHRHGDEEPWYVYHRTGLPCLVCGATVVDAEMAGRRAYWCPRCQRAPRR
ncbi:Fpg/Nei family DNA glycosylase [Georgenia faecalis]|uniref:DNA-(apurinic or apyrimidinic site) lyase n=1 Tax=Georgenia faecalis TaxID=2483799 RepID=A0ABV9DCQ7_9MICO|nr:zinc finger domain-containing protein [Georgenia faecalis]